MMDASISDPAGNVSCGMKQESRFTFTTLVFVGTQAGQHFYSRLFIFQCFFSRQITGQF